MNVYDNKVKLFLVKHLYNWLKIIDCISILLQSAIGKGTFDGFINKSLLDGEIHAKSLWKLVTHYNKKSNDD